MRLHCRATCKLMDAFSEEGFDLTGVSWQYADYFVYIDSIQIFIAVTHKLFMLF